MDLKLRTSEPKFTDIMHIFTSRWKNCNRKIYDKWFRVISERYDLCLTSIQYAIIGL